MPRNRIALTNTVAANLDRLLTEQGRSLDRPREVCDEVLDGLVLRRQPNGRRYWYYCYTTANGRRSRVALGAFPAVTVEAARAAAKPPAAQAALGTDPIGQKREQAERLRAERAARARAKTERLGHFVEHDYRKWAEAHLRAHEHTLTRLKADFGSESEAANWWDMPMGSLSSFAVERWRAAERKRGIRPSTINRRWQRLRAVLGKAVEWAVIPGPLPRVKPLRVGDQRVRFLTVPERARLLAALADRETERRAKRERMRAWQRARGKHELPPYPVSVFTDHLAPLVRLLLGTGLRRGEALQLAWGDIDWPRRQLSVRGETAKDKEQRFVPLTDDALEALKIWHAQARSTRPEAFVFPGPKGGRLLRVDTAWGELLTAAKITDFRLHDCRHDFASRLAMLGVGIFEISRLLGHSDIEMSQRYSHLSPDHLRAAVEKLNAADRAPTPKAENDEQGAQAVA